MEEQIVRYMVLGLQSLTYTEEQERFLKHTVLKPKAYTLNIEEIKKRLIDYIECEVEVIKKPGRYPEDLEITLVLKW